MGYAGSSGITSETDFIFLRTFSIDSRVISALAMLLMKLISASTDFRIDARSLESRDGYSR